MDKQTKYLLGTAGILALLTGAFYKRKTILHYVLNKEQEIFIKALNPAARNVFRKFILAVENTGWNTIVINGYRTFKKQEELHEENPANALPGRSMHNYGLALDLNFHKGTTLLKKSSTLKEWNDSGIPQIAKAIGLRWGGDFLSYPGVSHDSVHFELHFDPQKLLAQAKKQFGINTENIQGNQVLIT